MVFPEGELDGTHRLNFGPKGPCYASNCDSNFVRPVGVVALLRYAAASFRGRLVANGW